MKKIRYYGEPRGCVECRKVKPAHLLHRIVKIDGKVIPWRDHDICNSCARKLDKKREEVLERLRIDAIKYTPEYIKSQNENL